MSLQPGNTVQLKSGGPKMTVVEIMGTQIKVQWFEGATLKENIVPASSLVGQGGSVNEQILFG